MYALWGEEEVTPLGGMHGSNLGYIQSNPKTIKIGSANNFTLGHFVHDSLKVQSIFHASIKALTFTVHVLFMLFTHSNDNHTCNG